MQILWLIAALTVAGMTWQLARSLGKKQRRLVGMEFALMDFLAQRQEAKIKTAARHEKQKIVETSIDVGTDSAEVIHKAVAGITFGVLDTIPATEGLSKLVRGLHDGIAGQIYSTVRGSNKLAGELAKGHIKRKEAEDNKRPKRPEPPDKPPEAQAKPTDDGKKKPGDTQE